MEVHYDHGNGETCDKYFLCDDFEEVEGFLGHYTNLQF